VKHVKTGALIAVAAGSLFASACKKEEKNASASPPAPTDPAKADPAKPAQGGTPDPVAKPEQPPAEKVSQVDCGGVNECKGQGTCAQEGHGCGGQNACKGKGVLAMSEQECKDKGGTVVAKK
jgi:hypothetical protein